jgi:hypothetical protein
MTVKKNWIDLYTKQLEKIMYTSEILGNLAILVEFHLGLIGVVVLFYLFRF